MKKIYKIQLLDLNYNKFLNTLSKSDSVFAAANTKFAAFTDSIDNFNKRIGDPDSSSYKPVTEEDIKKFIEQRSDFQKFADVFAKLTIGTMIAYAMGL